MARVNFGNTLVVANPAAHSGRNASAAQEVEGLLASTGMAAAIERRLTAGPRDAASLAARSTGFDTIVAVGGDGLIHEVANGLMSLPHDDRPALAVIPMGSGNDFARTLGLRRNDAKGALEQLRRGRRRTIDLGRVSTDAGTSAHFVQTLSFGLDAAIALDTTRRRASGSLQRGSGLFVSSGLRIMATASRGYPCTMTLGESPSRELRELILAVQNGPTYGGGFRVCPHARPDDGLLDVCFNVSRPPTPALLCLFGLARLGRHTASRAIEVQQLAQLELDFAARQPPCQIDGEWLGGRHFSIKVEPRVLNIISP